MNDKYVCTYKQTYNRICAYIYTCAFVLYSGGMQTEEVGKSRRCTIAYIFLSVARTPQPRLERVPIPANGPATYVTHGQTQELPFTPSVWAPDPPAPPLRNRPAGLRQALCNGCCFARLREKLQKDRAKRKHFMSLDASVTTMLFLYPENVVIALPRQYTASNIVMQ